MLNHKIFYKLTLHPGEEVVEGAVVEPERMPGSGHGGLVAVAGIVKHALSAGVRQDEEDSIAAVVAVRF